MNSYQKNIKFLAWFNFFSDLVFFAPVVILYFQKVTGSYTLAMSVFSIATVSAAVFEVPTGLVSDSVGRKKTMIMGAFCSTLCLIFYALGFSFWLLVIGAIFQGLSKALHSGNSDALLHDTLDQLGRKGKYHVYLGRVSASFQIAMAVAAVIGALLASRSYALAMWLSVLPQLVCLILSFLIIDPKNISGQGSNIFSHLGKAIIYFRQNRRLRFLAFASALRASLWDAAFFLRSAFFRLLWPIWAIGFAGLLGHLAGALSYRLSSRAIDRFGFKKVLNFEIVFDSLLNFFALSLPTVLSPLLISGTYLTFGLGSVAANAALQAEFSQEERATLGSLTSLITSLLFGLISFLSGCLADSFGPAWALIAIAFFFLTPLCLYRLAFASEK